MDLQQTMENLARNGFRTSLCATAAEAKAKVLDLVPPGASVGVGGSVTVQQMGLREALLERGCEVFWHWYAEDRAEAQRRAHGSDVYLMSANAVTEQGELVNIDGSCNRLGTMLYGPGKVIVIAGKNKLAGDVMKAVERIKSVACPMNARRLKLSTPCALTGRCADCRSPQRMCSAVVRLQRPPAGREFHVILVEEELGY